MTEAVGKQKLRRGDQRKIAKRLGLSEALVSLVANNRPIADSPTTQRVRRAIEKRRGELAARSVLGGAPPLTAGATP
jgi:DNA-binding transcriptional regulator YdaS (Cro superfamily)